MTATDYSAASVYAANGTPTWTIHYAYDPFNNLVGRQVFNGALTAPSSSDHFVYNQGQIVLQLADSGAVEDRYLWAPVVDMLLGKEDASGNIFWALGDNENTIRNWTDVSGNVVAHEAYDPFGNFISGLSSGSVDAVFGWTGRFRDALTGMQYNDNRWYDAAIGKWMSRDPIGFTAGDANLYRYVGNQPTLYVDPSGEVKWNVTKVLRDVPRNDPNLWGNSPGFSTLARTNAAVNVYVPVECKANGKWGLKQETTVRLPITIFIVTPLSPAKRYMVLYMEDDHVDDISVWERAITPHLQKMEPNANQGIYNTEKEAKETLTRWFNDYVFGSLTAAMAESAQYWDSSGRHTDVRKPWPSTGHGRPAH